MYAGDHADCGMEGAGVTGEDTVNPTKGSQTIVPYSSLLPSREIKPNNSIQE